MAGIGRGYRGDGRFVWAGQVATGFGFYSFGGMALDAGGSLHLTGTMRNCIIMGSVTNEAKSLEGVDGNSTRFVVPPLLVQLRVRHGEHHAGEDTHHALRGWIERSGHPSRLHASRC